MSSPSPDLDPRLIAGARAAMRGLLDDVEDEQAARLLLSEGALDAAGALDAFDRQLAGATLGDALPVDATRLDRARRRVRQAPPLPARYAVAERLGEGATSVVYRARDRHTGREVAIKVLRPEVELHDAARARLLREARLAARLDHVNLVRVLDADVDPVPHLVMELVDGTPLSERLDGRPHPEHIGWLLDAAAGLAAAHAAGVVHRDVKPANILVADHRARVADFGLAALADGASLTRAGATLGTPRYMAPEQVEAEPGDVGPAADVYALGAICYELHTGRPPHDAPTVLGLLQAKATTDPPPISAALGLDAHPYDAICARALARDPGARYPDAAAFADAIEAHLAGASLAIVEGRRADTGVEWNVWKLVAVALVAVALGLVRSGACEDRTAPPAVVVDPADRAQLTALHARLVALGDRAPTALTLDVVTLSARLQDGRWAEPPTQALLAQVEARLSALERAPDPARPLRRQLAQLREALANVPDPELARGLDEAEASIAAGEHPLAARQLRQVASALTRRQQMRRLQAKQRALQQHLQRFGRRPDLRPHAAQVGPRVEQLQRLLQAGELDAAERQLDQLLADLQRLLGD